MEKLNYCQMLRISKSTVGNELSLIISIIHISVCHITWGKSDSWNLNTRFITVFSVYWSAVTLALVLKWSLINSVNSVLSAKFIVIIVFIWSYLCFFFKLEIYYYQRFPQFSHSKIHWVFLDRTTNVFLLWRNKASTLVLHRSVKWNASS